MTGIGTTATPLPDEARARKLFSSSSRLMLLDHFRVPYQVDPGLRADGLEQVRVTSDGPSLLWSSPSSEQCATAATLLAADRETEVPVFAKVLSDQTIKPLLKRLGGNWTPARELAEADGVKLGSIWRRSDGSVFLPFDPDEVLINYWSEAYLRIAHGPSIRRLRRVLMLSYYRVRPLLPRALQIWLRRRFARVQGRSEFPRWPIETCLDDFLELMLAILGSVAGAPIPCIAAWPHGHTWALALSHDVEHAEGLTVIDPVVKLERAHGVRSSWNFVPRRYEVDVERVWNLLKDGFEVGVHGSHHDGRDLESLSTWQDRLPGAHEAASRWGAVGFRSAALHRNWDWMRLLDFEYDSSYPDTDPFEPHDGGCCSWWPFFNGELVELPLTLPHDHTVFVILGELGASVWIEKTEFLRQRGGMALLNTHPDYLIDERIFSGYSHFLEQFASDPTVWKALPREISSWWRRRAASSLERDGQTWRIVGPAAGEGRLELSEVTW